MTDSAAWPAKEEVRDMAVLEHHEALLGRGIYDVGEIARLVRRSVDEVSTWSEGERCLLIPQERRVFSFFDLVSAAVVAELRRRGVPLEAVRDARQWLHAELDVPWPLAHAVGLEKLASAGRSVYFLSDCGWLDAGQGGQLPFKTVVDPLIRHLQFDQATAMAIRWRPMDGVVLDPAVQAGAPCVSGTRLTTELVAGLVAAGDDADDIADEYDVDVDLVRQALAYEESLAA